MQDNLSKSVQYIKSVGPKRYEAFKSIGLCTIRDLLFYFPFKYLDRSTILNTVKVREYVVGGFEGEVTLIGKVEVSEVVRYGKKSLLKVSMKDNTGYFDCVWFQGIKYFRDAFKEETYYAVSGKPVITKYGHLQFAHPDFDRIDDDESKDFLNTGRIIPFYSLPKGLKEKNIGAISIRRIVNYAVENFYKDIQESLPEKLTKDRELLSIQQTIKNIHFPSSKDLLDKAIHRLKYEELFYVEILVALRKHQALKKNSSIKFNFNTPLIKKFIKELPFKLTSAQLKVLREIRREIESGRILNRLIQGDVGSGKTIVALISMIAAVENGYQAALMAPTEVLASQHFINISRSLEGTDIEVILLIGSQKSRERKNILENIKTNKRCVVIGTHAMFEEKSEFNSLGLVVVDEQHRFGVIQRFRLIEKGINPHVLVMTATPIPRTLTMTLYGDMDVSTIDEMPSNRIKIKTALRSERKLPAVYSFIKERVAEGEQAYIVYPLVEESDKLDLKAAEIKYKELSETYFKDNKVGLLHGQMKWFEKEEVMKRFAEKEFEILISTTIIEVGIDIPSATIILIDDAHRFGLSQLHQLRGRVGRSYLQSYCILITKDSIIKNRIDPRLDINYLSPAQKEKFKASIRLNSMVENDSGFRLSEIDLKLRGPGDIFGTKQSGLPELKHADITLDEDILLAAKKDAFSLIEEDNNLEKNENKVILEYLKNNLTENINLSMIL